MPDPQTSHLVALIYDRYLGGYGIRALAEWLNGELGVRSSLAARSMH